MSVVVGVASGAAGYVALLILLVIGVALLAVGLGVSDGKLMWAAGKILGRVVHTVGGMGLMVLLHDFVRGCGVRTRSVEIAWNGIGDWMG